MREGRRWQTPNRKYLHLLLSIPTAGALSILSLSRNVIAAVLAGYT
jgi:hypothetical protein